MSNDSKGYNQARVEFADKYRKKILPFIKKFEAKRESTLAIATIGTALLTLVGVVFLIASFQVKDTNLQCFGASLLLFISAYSFPIHLKNSYESDIKQQIMPKIATNMSHFEWYSTYDGLNDVKELFLLPQYNYYFLRDTLSGEHRNVTIDIVESAFYNRGAGQNQLAFKGIILKFKMYKKFDSFTLITYKNLYKNVLNANISQFDFDFMSNIDPEKLKNDHTDYNAIYNSKYDFYTSKISDSKKILSIDLLARLEAIKNAYNGYKFTCCFNDFDCYVAIWTQDTIFPETTIFQSLDSSEYYFSMFNGILSATQLVDYLYFIDYISNQKNSL